MKLRAVYFLICFACLNIAARAGDMDGYLPSPGKIEGHFMRVTYPPRETELFKKMQAAISQDRQWFSDAIKNTKPGEPLPYDPKLGLTPDEYKEFLDLGRQATLKEVLVREINVVRNADNSISLDGGDDLKQLAALKFNAAQDTISTPYGDLSKPKAVDDSAKGKGGALGPYTGVIFGMEGGEEGSTIDNISGRSVSVTLGKFAGPGKHFIYYNVVVMDNGKRTTGIDMILVY